VSEKTLQKDSLEFRRVAHLWGALYISCADEYDLFRPDRLAEFLALSEGLRVRALQVPTIKGDMLLGREVDSWKPPSWLTLPAVSLPPPSNRK